MALKQELMAASAPAQLANRLGLDLPATVAAAGSGQTSATALSANCWNCSSGSGGVLLNSAEQIQFGYNSTGGSITVYPPSGFSFNFGTANAGVSLPASKSIIVIPAGATTLMANISA